MFKIRIKFVSLVINFLESVFYNNILKNKIRSFVNDNEILFKKIDEIHIVDCGANKGQSAIFYNSLFPSNTIYCFEANPEIFHKLQNNTSKIKNIQLFNCALGSKESVVTLNICILDEISTFLKPDFSSEYLKFKSRVLLTRRKDLYKKIDVKMNTLDYFYSNSNIKYMHFLKIDIEGYEYQLLQGSKLAINKLKPLLILVEIHFDDQYKNNNQQTFDLLSSLNYDIYDRIKHPFGNFYDYLFVRSIPYLEN